MQKCYFEQFTARLTTPKRTLIDCFKFRNKIGLPIFLEAARMGQSSSIPPSFITKQNAYENSTGFFPI